MTTTTRDEIRVDPDPFPHLVADGLWEPDLLDQVIREFPHPQDPRWIRYAGTREVKLHGDQRAWGSATEELLRDFQSWTDELGGLFEIENLNMETVGGGMHLIPPGGHLDIHVDFNRSPDTRLYRRLNLMCYLNDGWTESGGYLELDGSPDGEIRTYAPLFNRTVVFESSDRSWHGHPRPATRWRMSVAAYYFSPDPPVGYGKDHSTVWLNP
jgi:Rps23 Pro-64 3,4-dihydroxylase Tpa1-like proline 4-hydroxylase